jgi:hypothetical protein
MAGYSALQRIRDRNPEAWELRLTVSCPACPAAAGEECFLLDGSGGHTLVTHIGRVEKIAHQLLNEELGRIGSGMQKTGGTRT